MPPRRELPMPKVLMAAAALLLAGCSQAPAPVPVPEPSYVDPDEQLAYDYADVVLAETTEDTLYDLCRVYGSISAKKFLRVFTKGYTEQITDDDPPPALAAAAYREKLYALCVMRGWIS